VRSPTGKCCLGDVRKARQKAHEKSNG
jgi:hypothetical protein